jgi:hypothetical protein
MRHKMCASRLPGTYYNLVKECGEWIMRCLWELLISKISCSSNAFICRPRLAQPNSRTAASPKLFTFREVGTQVFPVTMSCPSLRTTAQPCLPLCIKVSLKEEKDICFEAFALRLLHLVWCFLILAFWWGSLFDVGGFWKRKKWMKGKDCWREKNCWRRISKRELLASLRAKTLGKL